MEDTTDKQGPDTYTSATSTRVATPVEMDEKNKLEIPENENAMSEKASVEEPLDEYPKGISLLFIVVALVLSIFLASLDMTIVATAIPKITDDFGGLDKVSWYGSAFFMTNGGFQSSWGKAYKYFPLKTTFLLSVFVFELGSLVCGVAPNATALIIGRAITGVGAAGLGTGAYTIIAFVAEPRKRAAYTGIVGVSYGVASVVGPLIGGVFADHATWRWCFYVNLPIGGVSALVIFFFFHTPTGAKPTEATLKEKLLQMDPLGTVFIMGALVSFILALEYGGQAKPWNSSVIIGLLVGFVLIVLTFLVWERTQGERAMIPPRLIKQRTVSICCAFTFAFSGSYFLVIYYLPIYFQSVHNVNPTMSGVYNLPLIIAVTISMISSGMFIGKTGLAVPMQVIGSALAVIGAGLLYLLDRDTSTGRWIGYQILGGVGWGLAFQIPLIMGQGSVDSQDLSCVTAIVLFFMNLGGTLFVTASQSIFVNKLVNTLPSTAPGVDAASVVATGATQIRSVFPADQVSGIIESYMMGLKDDFALAIAATGFATLVSALHKWKRLGQGSGAAAAAA